MPAVRLVVFDHLHFKKELLAVEQVAGFWSLK